MKKNKKKQHVLNAARRRVNLPEYASKAAVIQAICDELKVPLPTTWEQRYKLMERWIEGAPIVAKATAVKRSAKALRAQSDAFLESYEWRRLRMEVIKECGARCECCGASPKDKDVRINVDHVKP